MAESQTGFSLFFRPSPSAAPPPSFFFLCQSTFSFPPSGRATERRDRFLFPLPAAQPPPSLSFSVARRRPVFSFLSEGGRNRASMQVPRELPETLPLLFRADLLFFFPVRGQDGTCPFFFPLGWFFFPPFLFFASEEGEASQCFPLASPGALSPPRPRKPCPSFSLFSLPVSDTVGIYDSTKSAPFSFCQVAVEGHFSFPTRRPLIFLFFARAPPPVFFRLWAPPEPVFFREQPRALFSFFLGARRRPPLSPFSFARNAPVAPFPFLATQCSDCLPCVPRQQTFSSPERVSALISPSRGRSLARAAFFPDVLEVAGATLGRPLFFFFAGRTCPFFFLGTPSVFLVAFFLFPGVLTSASNSSCSPSASRTFLSKRRSAPLFNGRDREFPAAPARPVFSFLRPGVRFLLWTVPGFSTDSPPIFPAGAFSSRHIHLSFFLRQRLFFSKAPLVLKLTFSQPRIPFFSGRPAVPQAQGQASSLHNFFPPREERPSPFLVGPDELLLDQRQTFVRAAALLFSEGHRAWVPFQMFFFFFPRHLYILSILLFFVWYDRSLLSGWTTCFSFSFRP